MKRFGLILALVLCASSAFAAIQAPPSYAWNYTWSFTSGLEGWTKATGGGNWVDAAVQPYGPTLPDGSFSGAGGNNLYAPDGTRFAFDVTALNLKANRSATPTDNNGFVLQADVYIPNMAPLTGFPNGNPGNGLEKFGIGFDFKSGTTYKTAWIRGNMGEDNIIMKDRTWDNVDRRTGEYYYLDGPGTVKADWWDGWVTMVYDYGYTTKGKMTAYCYVPWDANGAGAWHMTAQYEVGDWALQSIIVGSVTNTNSWSQGQIDNVKFAYVPEPASLLALGTGLMGLFGAIRRRK